MTYLVVGRALIYAQNKRTQAEAHAQLEGKNVYFFLTFTFGLAFTLAFGFFFILPISLPSLSRLLVCPSCLRQLGWLLVGCLPRPQGTLAWISCRSG